MWLVFYLIAAVVACVGDLCGWVGLVLLSYAGCVGCTIDVACRMLWLLRG